MKVPTLPEKVLRSRTDNNIANLSNKKAPKPHPWVKQGKYFFSPKSVLVQEKTSIFPLYKIPTNSDQ